MNWIDPTGLSTIGRHLAGQGSGAAGSATLGDRMGRAIQDGVDSLSGRLSPQSKPSVPTQPNWNHPDPYANPIPKPLNNDWDGGSAVTPAPYTHSEEREARYFTPDPFGGNCEQLKRAIQILRAQIAWRKTDLNPQSSTFGTHKAHIPFLQNALKKLEEAYVEDSARTKCYLPC